ncbi:MAG: hypothetical protein IGS48_01410 [Oscillatoriales cyanobacterium C42_A2020_001]|nr:hypothetical protein [Leptolyngbyaceae cyanobacterium C42_A2020_001]
MSQRDGFSSGFLLGTLVGGVVGGVVGALITARQLTPTTEADEAKTVPNPLDAKPTKRRRLFQAGREGVDMEAARRSLEDKIAQLNDAIDDVRQQLGGVNGEIHDDVNEPAIAPDPRRQS